MRAPSQNAATTAALMATSLCISDHEFDGVFPDEIRNLSSLHWTPIEVAERAAQIFSSAGATRVLDVGSGPGKFCIVGALVTGLEFHGVEQRPGLVTIAREAAQRLGAQRAHFVNANVLDTPFHPFDGFYLFNPFYEQISYFVRQVDKSIERSRDNYDRYVRTVIRKLALTRPGTIVVTYNGFGGDMPLSFSQFGDEKVGRNQLETWVQS